MYEVTVGEDSFTFDGRAEAVAAAKRMSGQQRRRAEVLDAAGREEMTFARGELETYIYNTNGRRPRDA